MFILFIYLLIKIFLLFYFKAIFSFSSQFTDFGTTFRKQCFYFKFASGRNSSPLLKFHWRKCKQCSSGFFRPSRVNARVIRVLAMMEWQEKLACASAILDNSVNKHNGLMVCLIIRTNYFDFICPWKFRTYLITLLVISFSQEKRRTSCVIWRSDDQLKFGAVSYFKICYNALKEFYQRSFTVNFLECCENEM